MEYASREVFVIIGVVYKGVMSVDLNSFVDFKDILSHVTDIAPLVAVVFFTTFSRKIKSWLENKVNAKFERSINKTSLVRDHLAELRAIYEADRVLLFQLHNGQYYFSGEGADKLSLTHFVVGAGVAVPDRAGTRLQNIPTTYWPELFETMSKKGYVFAAAALFTDPFAAQMFSMDGVSYVICGPVKDRRGHWRGMLIVSFLSDVPQQKVAIATEYGQKLGDLLSL